MTVNAAGWSGIRFDGAPLRQRSNPSDHTTREDTHS